MDKTKALFLDRDGILIEDSGYICDPEKLVYMNDIVPLIKKANSAGWKVIVISNQSGVARGYFSEKDVIAVNEKIDEHFESKGAKIDDFFYCTSLDSNNPCRKPNPGLFVIASKKHKINLAGSIMIGDKETDVIKHMGIESFIIKGKYPVSPGFEQYVIKDYSRLIPRI